LLKDDAFKLALVDGKLKFRASASSHREFMRSPIYSDFSIFMELCITSGRDSLEFQGENVEFTRGQLDGFRKALGAFQVMAESLEQEENEDGSGN